MVGIFSLTTIKDAYLSEYDFVFKKLEDVGESLLITTKLDGANWEVLFISESIKDISQLKISLPLHTVNLTVATTRENIKILESTSMLTLTFMEQIGSVLTSRALDIDTEALKFLVSASAGSMSSAIEIISTIILGENLKCDGEDITITKKIVSKYTMVSSITYVMDAVLAYFVAELKCVSNTNSWIEDKFARKTFANVWYDLQETLPNNVAFYAFRKRIRLLYEMKLEYLAGKVNLSDVKFTEAFVIQHVPYQYIVNTLLTLNKIENPTGWVVIGGTIDNNNR